MNSAAVPGTLSHACVALHPALEEGVDEPSDCLLHDVPVDRGAYDRERGSSRGCVDNEPHKVQDEDVGIHTPACAEFPSTHSLVTARSAPRGST